MIKFFENVVESTWAMMVDSAFLLLIGIVLAGLISLFLNADKFKKRITGNGFSDVFKAALLGVPLPLCSCSVLPVAQQLRASGVSRGGTVSFLISTPESGVDSILLTYSLTDPIMTVARPVTAFLTAVSAGMLEAAVGKEEKQTAQLDIVDDSSGGCCCETNSSEIDNRSLAVKIIDALKYAFTILLDDLAPYLLLGYLLAGLVSAVLGDGLLSLSETFTAGWGSYLGAIIIGVPLYICATSSTPLAAALLAGGFTPGAVLVFMMVGPATNIASLVVVSRILKGWSVVRYLAVIIVIAILSGLVVDWIYQYTGLSTVYQTMNDHEHTGIVGVLSAALLSLMVMFYSLRKMYRKLF